MQASACLRGIQVAVHSLPTLLLGRLGMGQRAPLQEDYDGEIAMLHSVRVSHDLYYHQRPGKIPATEEKAWARGAPERRPHQLMAVLRLGRTGSAEGLRGFSRSEWRLAGRLDAQERQELDQHSHPPVTGLRPLHSSLDGFQKLRLLHPPCCSPPLASRLPP